MLAPWQSARGQGATTTPSPGATTQGQGATTQGQGATAQPGAAAAQGGTVTGQVTATYGEPLSGIAVGVKGSRQRVRTDARGNFTLTGLPPGSHTIEASAQGFISQTRQVTVTEGAPASTTFSLDPDLLGSEEIVVTAQTPDRKVRSSTAITTATAEDIQIRMPRNTADLLRIVPGFYTESSGGEVGGNVFVRGLPADGSYRYVAMMEDGMPVFDSTELFFVNNDIFVRVDENIERMEAVRGGTSALYGSNAPGGVINFLNKHGGDKLAGTIRATTATSGLFRYDANVNGPIGDDWRFSAGGFYRYDEGIRNPGFPASHGGQFKGSLTRLITGDKVNGHARVTFKYLNDRNTFYLPLPFRGQFNNQGRLTDHQFVPGFPVDGTLTSREGVNAEVPLPGGGQLNLPLQNGQQQIGASTMAELRLYFPETRLEVQNHTRLMQMDHSWNAMLPFELRDANAWAQSVVGAGTPYRITCSQVRGAPEFGGPGCPSENNLVALGGQWLVEKPMTNVSNQLRFTKFGELGPTEHTLTGGLYLGYYTAGNTWYFNDIVTDVRDRPHFVDLQILDGGGNVVGSATKNGFRNYLSNYVNATGSGTIAALFLGDEVKVGDKLRFDLAGRIERDTFHQDVERTASFNLGDTTTTADDNVRYGTGSFQRVNVALNDWALSGGVNYAISDTSSAYARSSRGYKMPLLDQYLFATDASDPTFPVTPETLWQNEVGYKVGGPWYALAAVAYWLEIANFPSQDARVDPVTGETRFVTTYAGQARTLGLELEAAVQPVKFFRAQGMLTVQDPRYTRFIEGSTTHTGNRVRRIPQVIADLNGTFMYENASLGINWSFVGHRFSNNANTVDLNAFNQFNLRAAYAFQNFTVDLQVHNVFNSTGLTEGNPRVDESAGAQRDLFLARPVLPRRFTLTLSAAL